MRKTFRKIISIIIIGMIFFSNTSYSTETKVKQIEAIDYPTDYRNANPVEVYIDNRILVGYDFEVKPMIINGRTMIPITLLTEAIGSPPMWDSFTNSVLIRSFGIPIFGGVHNTKYEGYRVVNVVVDYNIVTSDVPAIIINGKAMVPLKMVSEILGANITWNPVNRTVHVERLSTDSIEEREVEVNGNILKFRAKTADGALSSAQNFISKFSCSKDFLYKTLRFQGYTDEFALYGVENCDVDWMTQAFYRAVKLEYYFSTRESLIKQLEYEGFSSDEASYGVNELIRMRGY